MNNVEMIKVKYNEIRAPIQLILILILISCKENKEVRETISAKRIINNEKPVKLMYYKCDYSNRFDTLLSAGSQSETHEVWGVNRKDIKKFPVINISKVDTSTMVKSAESHLKQRFSNMHLELSDFQIQPINEQDKLSQRNWFAEITFLYDKRGYYQKVPMLLDQRIILSNNETKH